MFIACFVDRYLLGRALVRNRGRCQETLHINLFHGVECRESYNFRGNGD